MKFCLFLPMILLLNLQLGCAPRDKSRRSTFIPTPNPSEDGSHPWTQGNPVQPEPSPLPIPEPSLPINGFEAIAAMGSGFNLGNIFDRKDKPTTVDEMKAIIDLYYQAGHRHVRLPVTWMDDFEGDHLADANGQLRTNHPRLRDLTTVIDYALAKPMFVIINTHHERWLKRDYKAGTSDVIFANLWHQIAQHFAGYPYELIFEVLNEPEGVFGDFTGPVSPFDAEPMRLTRHINEVGYQAIRNSDPRNQQRLVLILPNAQGNQTLLDEVYPNKGDLPDDGNDPYLAVSLHTYDPWTFCGEDGSNTKWPGSQKIVETIDAAFLHAQTLGVAVNYGEFGVGRKVNQNERNTDIVRQYYQLMTQTILDHGMAPTVWDDRGWFGLVEKTETRSYRFKYDLVPNALKSDR